MKLPGARSKMNQRRISNPLTEADRPPISKADLHTHLTQCVQKECERSWTWTSLSVDSPPRVRRDSRQKEAKVTDHRVMWAFLPFRGFRAPPIRRAGSSTVTLEKPASRVQLTCDYPVIAYKQRILAPLREGSTRARVRRDGEVLFGVFLSVAPQIPKPAERLFIFQ